MNNDNLAHDLQMQDDYETPEGDTTSEGGSGAPHAFSPSIQRHADKVPAQAQRTEPPSNPNPNPGPSSGLIDQSPDGGPLSSELQDAQQGSDPRAREAFAHAARRDFDRLGSPYDRRQDSAERGERGERGGRGASAYADARGRQFESGPAGGEGEDVGAF